MTMLIYLSSVDIYSSQLLYAVKTCVNLSKYCHDLNAKESSTGLPTEFND